MTNFVSLKLRFDTSEKIHLFKLKRKFYFVTWYAYISMHFVIVCLWVGVFHVVIMCVDGFTQVDIFKTEISILFRCSQGDIVPLICRDSCRSFGQKSVRQFRNQIQINNFMIIYVSSIVCNEFYVCNFNLNDLQ